MKYFFFFLSFLLLSSCVKYKDLVGLSKLNDSYSYDTDEYKIQPGDFLDIRVYSFEPQSVAIFNKEYGDFGSNQINDASLYLSSYM